MATEQDIFSKLSDAQLQAVSSGDLSSLDDATLQMLAGSNSVPSGRFQNGGEGDPNDPSSLAFERSANFPGQGITSFGPSVNVALAAQGPAAAKAGFGALSSGVKSVAGAAKGAANLGGRLVKTLGAGTKAEAGEAILAVKTGLPQVTAKPFTVKEIKTVLNEAPKLPQDVSAAVAEYATLPKQDLVNKVAQLKKGLEKAQKLGFPEQYVNYVRHLEAAEGALKKVVPGLAEANQQMARSIAKEALLSPSQNLSMLPLIGPGLSRVSRRVKTVADALKNVK